MSDFDAQLPVRALAINFTTEVANAAGTTINPAEDYPQASTTLGQNGVLNQGAVTTAAPTYANNTTSPLSLDLAGNLRVTSSAVALQNVNITQVGGNAVTTTVPVSGSVAVSNFPADADALAQGSTTSGQLGVLDMGAVTTAAPTYVTGQTSPLSITLAGALRVDGSAVTQPVSGTFFQATQPVSGTVTVTQATGTNLHTVVDNFPADADALAQGSTTSGQLGALTMGAVTTAAPAYTTGQTDPLSLTTGGALRVAVVESNPVLELFDYNTAAAIAPGATSTHTFTPGGTVYLDAFNFTASGQMKVEIQVAGVTKFVAFTSKSTLTGVIQIANPFSTSSVITLIRTNEDKSAMDVYSTVQYHN